MSEHSFNIEDAKRYGVERAIILKHLRFWLDKNVANGRHCHQGYYWTYNSARALSELFPYWSSNKIQKLLKAMEAEGLILSGCFNENPYDRTKWYSMPEYHVDEVRRRSAEANKPVRSTDSANRLNEKVQSAECRKGQSAECKTDVNTDVKPDSNQVIHGPSGDGPRELELTPPSSSPAKKKRKAIDYTPEFETAWAVYPKRPNNSKSDAFKSWQARINEGVTPDEMLEGLHRYREFVEAEEIEPRFIKQAATFFGPGRHWENDYTPTSPRPDRAPRVDDSKRRASPHGGYDKIDYSRGIGPDGRF